MSEAILDSAAMFPEPLLRSLDAIHLASAPSITAVTAVLAFDKHLIDAARNAGLAGSQASLTHSATGLCRAPGRRDAPDRPFLAADGNCALGRYGEHLACLVPILGDV